MQEHACKSQINDELSNADKVIRGMVAVMGEDDDALQLYIASFDEAMGDTGKREIGKAPPCRNYAQLVTLNKIEQTNGCFEDCLTKASLDSLAKEIAAMKKPTQSLVAACSSCSSELKKARTAWTSSQEESKKAVNTRDKARMNLPQGGGAMGGLNWVMLAAVERVRWGGGGGCPPPTVGRCGMVWLLQNIMSVNLLFRRHQKVLPRAARYSSIWRMLWRYRVSPHAMLWEELIGAHCAHHC